MHFAARSTTRDDDIMGAFGAIAGQLGQVSLAHEQRLAACNLARYAQLVTRRVGTIPRIRNRNHATQQRLVFGRPYVGHTVYLSSCEANRRAVQQ